VALVEFEVTPVERGSDRLLQVSGELDVATVGQLRAAVQSAFAQHPPTLLVDLTDTRFIDSTGCRELVRCAKAGEADGVAVEVVAPPVNWRVRRVIDLVQLSALVPVHDDVPAP
jgi:anti-sigma B factor antagonist